MRITRKQPLDFRFEEVRSIMQKWRAGTSCSLVGSGSIGKSNLLHHLSDSDTHKHFLEDNAQKYTPIIIDPNLLGPYPTTGDNAEQFICWAGYELMMNRLYLNYYPLDSLSQDDADQFYDLYAHFQDGSNPLYMYMGLRYLEMGLEIFFKQGTHIIFMFDEFEEMLKHMPVKFFQTLRGLRDANKGLLSYLTFTRAPLPILVREYKLDVLGLEPFIELFTDNLIYVGPYEPRDSQKMIERLMSRNNQRLSPDVIDFLQWASGGYAGVLRASYNQITKMNINIAGENRNELVNKLARQRPIREECRTIWTSLTKPEQHVLKVAAQLAQYENSPEIEQAVPMLVQKKLLHVDKLSNSLHIRPPLLNEYVISNPPEIA